MTLMLVQTLGVRYYLKIGAIRDVLQLYFYHLDIVSVQSCITFLTYIQHLEIAVDPVFLC